MREFYEQLRSIAYRMLGNRSREQTLRPTALVHEAYVRLGGFGSDSSWNHRQRLALAAQAMRSVIVDHVRRARAKKRTANGIRVPIEQVISTYEHNAFDILALNDALDSLELMDDRLARIVEMRFFCGLSVEETADALGISDRTLRREWRVARTFLYKSLAGEPHHDGRAVDQGEENSG